MILEALKNLFKDKSLIAETEEEEGLAIAAGVLMLEIARADDEIDDLEKEVVIEGIKRILCKTDDEIDRIFQQVITIVEELVSLFEFTSLIKVGVMFVFHRLNPKLIKLFIRMSL